MIIWKQIKVSWYKIVLIIFEELFLQIYNQKYFITIIKSQFFSPSNKDS